MPYKRKTRKQAINAWKRKVLRKVKDMMGNNWFMNVWEYGDADGEPRWTIQSAPRFVANFTPAENRFLLKTAMVEGAAWAGVATEQTPSGGDPYNQAMGEVTANELAMDQAAEEAEAMQDVVQSTEFKLAAAAMQNQADWAEEGWEERIMQIADAAAAAYGKRTNEEAGFETPEGSRGESTRRVDSPLMARAINLGEPMIDFD